MDFNPMNSLQIIVPKATEISQVQHNLNQQPVIQQDFEAMRQKADAALKQKQVRSREELEDGKIKDDPERKGKQGKYTGNRKRHVPNEDIEESGDEAKIAVDSFRGHNIDIKF